MSKIDKSKYTHRSLARIVIEAKTPLAIGSGQKDILSDSLVMLDVNGLPYIPGTSIAGVVRSMVDPVTNHSASYFGYQLSEDDKEKSGLDKSSHGSEIIFSEARILNSKQQVVDGIATADELADPLLSEYRKMLPVRQHVCIDDKGTAKKGGKFDQQVVYAGTRFCFEIEMLSDGSKDKDFGDVLNAINHESFRIGGGVHNGFGSIHVNKIFTKTLNLCDSQDLDMYLEKDSSLSAEWPYWDKVESVEKLSDEQYMSYSIELTAVDFMFFGSGYGDSLGDADMTTVRASRVCWDSGMGILEKDLLLIPATSLKGALRHRVAYHHNKLLHRYVDDNTNGAPKDADNDEAVRALFGYQEQERKKLVAGKVLMSDIIEKTAQSKLVNHVCIDRFTGGAIDGALFTEQVDYAGGRKFELEIMVEKSAFNGDKIKESFEMAIKDLCEGLLPLGGGVNRGNGIFKGSYKYS